MDIFNRVNYEATFDYVLKDPETGDDTDIVFQLRSVNCEAAKKVDLKYLNAVKSGNMRKEALPVERDLEYAYDKVAACIAGWSDTLKKDGEKYEYTPENVASIVRIDWIFSQLNKQIEDIKNFTK